MSSKISLFRFERIKSPKFKLYKQALKHRTDSDSIKKTTALPLEFELENPVRK